MDVPFQLDTRTQLITILKRFNKMFFIGGSDCRVSVIMLGMVYSLANLKVHKVDQLINLNIKAIKINKTSTLIYNVISGGVTAGFGWVQTHPLSN